MKAVRIKGAVEPGKEIESILETNPTAPIRSTLR